jgi:hypothetical protein
MTGDDVSQWPALELHISEPKKAELESKLTALKFESYQQFALACASLLISEHPAFVQVVGQACHLEREVPQMTWTEPGKDSDEDL